jgi:enoyl-CoA hydratase/carnithine racemase
MAMVDLERTVLYEVSDHVATVTINRPKRYNSLNYLAYKELTEAFEKANLDSDVHAIIFTGTGRGFCTGDDVKELLGAGAKTSSRPRENNCMNVRIKIGFFKRLGQLLICQII